MTPDRPAVRLRRPLGPTIRRGHPWLYDQALGPLALPPGTIATVVDRDGPVAREATAVADEDSRRSTVAHVALYRPAGTHKMRDPKCDNDSSG